MPLSVAKVNYLSVKKIHIEHVKKSGYREILHCYACFECKDCPVNKKNVLSGQKKGEPRSKKR